MSGGLCSQHTFPQKPSSIGGVGGGMAPSSFCHSVNSSFPAFFHFGFCCHQLTLQEHSH